MIKFDDKLNAVVMEFAQNGTIQEYLEHCTTPVGRFHFEHFCLLLIDWNLRLKWTIQLLDAVLHLHSKQIIHRDLRCVNVLVIHNNSLNSKPYSWTTI